MGGVGLLPIWNGGGGYYETIGQRSNGGIVGLWDNAAARPFLTHINTTNNIRVPLLGHCLGQLCDTYVATG